MTAWQTLQWMNTKNALLRVGLPIIFLTLEETDVCETLDKTGKGFMT